MRSSIWNSSSGDGFFRQESLRTAAAFRRAVVRALLGGHRPAGLASPQTMRVQKIRQAGDWRIRSACLRLLLALASAFAAGCATVPAPDASDSRVATIVVATFQAAASAAPAPSVGATPSDVPTPVPPTLEPTAGPPTRINFLSGATTAVVTGSIRPAEVQSFVLHADLGQPLLVQLNGVGPGAALSVRSAGGTVLLSAAALQTAWRGTLPQTENYYVDVHGGAGGEKLSLTVKLARKIKFKEGAVSALVPGQTVGGSVMVYTVLGIKGRTMDIGLSGVADDAALSVDGYVDGRSYLRAEEGKVGFSMEVPSTQDYVVEVVPKGTQALSYTLGVVVQ